MAGGMPTDVGNVVAVDRDVTRIRRLAGSVVNESVTDDGIVLRARSKHERRIAAGERHQRCGDDMFQCAPSGYFLICRGYSNELPVVPEVYIARSDAPCRGKARRRRGGRPSWTARPHRR